MENCRKTHLAINNFIKLTLRDIKMTLQLKDILQLYLVKKNSVEKNELYYKRLYNLL